ncbi:MAG: MFS transporter, partial [Henriciella sp.]|nr:MFS transporter [Henriciella sp.]
GGMNAATNQPSILTLRLGQSDQAGQKNPPLMRIFGIIIVASICLAMFNKNILYFFKYNLERPDLRLWALITPALCLFFMVPVWVMVAGRSSKRTALLVGGGISLIGYIAFFLVPETPAYVMTAILLIGIGVSALSVMFWSMLPDTVEYGEVHTGVRAEAKTFGFATFAQKAAVGVNALLLGALLDGMGFEANVEQSSDVLLAIKAIMVGVPALGVLAIFGLLWGYQIDHRAHARLRHQLQTGANR